MFKFLITNFFRFLLLMIKYKQERKQDFKYIWIIKITTKQFFSN